ncbi:MAG: thiamine phosphate synthase [Planctomycetes bacterium]|nr:thiamine phosphate synthase [Planctomycetota bacterium]
MSASSIQIYRVLDASFNRAGEGLRVIEDYVRFALDDPLLTSHVKSLRHDFGALAASIPADQRHAARDTLCDVGTGISNAGERFRGDAWDVCAASLKRAEQSLRSIEEYGKLIDADFAGQAESLRYRLYTLEKVIDLGRTSRDRLKDVRLCVLVDGCNSITAFERLVAELVEAGVGMIQLRDKSLDDRDLIERARLLVSLTRGQPPALPGVSVEFDRDTEKPPAKPGAASFSRSRTLAIINDRPDIAATVDADGVHLGQDDLGVKDARAIVATRMLIGVSTHNIDQARAAVLDGANYLGAGPTFSSQTKKFETFAGLNYLRELAGEIRLPTFAIGGISAQNLRDVLASGVSRVAVGAAVTQASNPSIAIHELMSILNESSAR